MSLDVLIPHIPGDAGAFLLAGVALAVVLLLLLIALCGPLFGTVAEVFFLKTHKVFYEKCALQLTRFVSAVGLLAGLAAVGAGWLLLRRHAPELLEPPFGLRLIFFILVPAVGYGLFLVRRATWTGLNHLPKTRFLLGLLPAGLGLALMARFILPLEQARLFVFNPQTTGAGGALLEALSPDARINALMAPHFAYALFTGLAATAVFAVWRLFLRRAREDYGRDYYAFALKFCAFWGAGLTAAATGAAWWVFSGLAPETADPAALPRFLCTAGCALVACLLLLVLGKSPVPMRHKPTAVLAGLFFAAAFFGQLALFHLAVMPAPAP